MSEARVHVKAQPSASKNEIVSFEQGVLKVRVAAPPVRGRANAELVSFLAKSLGLSRTQVSIVSGAMSRDKLIAIAGNTQKDVEGRLKALCG
ncbi:MAG: DUF167 domain-containing protein [Dehalococcoidia bacterium]|nr:DUF167 domain-containing protein [Dehalococcoidia bacterium]